MSGDYLRGKFDWVIRKEKPKEEIVPDENIIFSLSDFEIKQEMKKQKR